MKFVFLFAGFALLVGFGWLIGPSLLTREGDMADPRSEIHAAKLGDELYTAGGIGFFRTLQSCAKYDVAMRRWARCPDLPRALHHVALAAGTDRIYTSGGYRSLPFRIDARGAVFALARGDAAWSQVTRLPRPLGQHSMSFHDGALYLVGGDTGGETVATVWRYDLESGRWTTRAPMSRPRHSHAVAQDPEALYVTGGRGPSTGNQSASVERYVFAADKWTSLPDMPAPLAGHGAAVIANELHVFGGENLDAGLVHDRHDILNLATGTWRSGAALPEARHGFGAAVASGRIWVLGGGRRPGLRTPFSVSGTAIPVAVN